MKKSQEIETICKKLKPILGDKADILWHTYLAEDEKGRRALELDIELLEEKLLKTDSLSTPKIILPPPSQNDASGSILLGDTIYNDKPVYPVYLKPEDFTRQIGIFAVTGEGKTNLAYLLSLQLLRDKVPFMVIDWKRSWRNLLSLKDQYPELKKVQIFTIGRDVIPFLWNPFRQPPNADGQLWISSISETLEKSHLSGPGVAYYFNRIYSKYVKSLTADFYPNFFDGTKEIESIKAFERELKWKQTALRIFQSFTLGSISKVFNARNPIKLEELLDGPVILELDLEMPKSLRIFFTEIILRWIHLFRLSQGETGNLRHVLFLEEVHNLFVQSPFTKEANNSIENIYREIRAFGQGIVSITQHPSLLPVYLLGNCHTQIFLGLQHSDDINTARKSLFLDRTEEAYLNLLKIGESITKIKNRVDPCLVKTPLVPIKSGIVNDGWLKAHHLSYQLTKYSVENFRFNKEYPKLKRSSTQFLTSEQSLQSTGSTKKLLQKNTPGHLSNQSALNTQTSALESMKTSKNQSINTADNKKPMKNKYQARLDCDRLLADVYLHPYSSVTRRYKRLNLNSNSRNVLRKKAIAQKLLYPRKVITAKGWITLFDLTQKGRLMLRDLGYEVKNTKEGIIHRYWKWQVAEYYKKQNMEVLVEETINGRADIIVIDKSSNKKTAIEIETGKSYALQNIQRALKAGFDKVFSIGTNRFVKNKIVQDLKAADIQSDRIEVYATQELSFL